MSFVGEILQQHKSQVAAIELRIVRLEAALAERAALKYLGTFKAEKTYSENTLITHDGSLWIALKSTREKPGASGDWQLCCKKGADGKDAAA
jgi:hypothetical protein